MLNEILRLTEHRYVAPIFVACLYTGLREKEEAFAWLERAYEERAHIPLLAISPVFDYLRPDPRFAVLLRRSGLPADRPPNI